MKALLKTFLLCIVVVLQCSCQNRESEIFILPEDYIGYAIVVFNQKDGEKPKYFEGKRVYEIPSNGILKTQFEADYGMAEKFESFTKSVSEKNRIKSGVFNEGLSESMVSVCCYSNGKAYSRNNESISYLKVFIGTKSEVKEITTKFEKLDLANLVDN